MAFIGRNLVNVLYFLDFDMTRLFWHLICNYYSTVIINIFKFNQKEKSTYLIKNRNDVGNIKYHPKTTNQILRIARIMAINVKMHS